jgi:pectin methylesterase-like acyl-CoA thioesterase
MPKRILSASLKKFLLTFCAALSALAASAATVVWSGASGTDTNWSTGGNWIGGVPGGGDDVKFFDAAAVGTAGGTGTNTPNNLVDASFGGILGSLQYGNTNGNHTTVISAGATLNVTNTGGLTVGTLTAPNTTQKVYATITGDGTLNISNAAANIIINQGTNTATGGANMRANLDLTGLANFNATVSRIGIGTSTLGGPNNVQSATGTLLLGKTNVIRATFPGTPITTATATPTNSVEVGSDNGNAGGVNFLYLGQTNTFYIDSIGVGTLKTTASLLFNPSFVNSTAYFRGTGGDTSRVRFWTIGDMSSSGSSSANCNGTNDFSGGSVDLLVDTMSLGRDRSGGNTGTTVTKGTLTFTAGTVDVNTIYIGNQQFTAAANSNPMAGVVNVNGPTATLKVNTALVLGRTSVGSPAAAATTGILNVTNGTVLANSILVGTNSTGGSTTNIINLVNASLIVTNTLATNATGLSVLNISNATLGLTLTANGSLRGLVRTLNTIGATNLIQLDSAPVLFASYPQQIPLIKYTAWTGSNSFGLASIPAWAPGATLVSNGPNQSLDLLLPYNPRPVITAQPVSYSGSPGDDVAFNVTVDANSVPPLNYQWYLGAAPLADGATGNGSTIYGSTTASLAVTNAQAGDNGSYTVVIANTYGSATSAPPAVLTISAGDVAPGLTGPNNQTVIQGNNATFSATASGNPTPALQWQRNGVDLPGQTGGSYIVTNAQFATDNGAVFSLVATNLAGSVTNSAMLTVIVPPAISAQPVSLIVTNTQAASFSVTASGVPTPTYQWYFNNNPISTATNATLNLAGAVPANIGNYKVVVTNAAGFVTSSNATLIVNSLLSTTAFSPANGATGICYDTPLAVTFSSAPSLGAAGTIKIFNATNSSTPVDTINVALGAVQSRTFPGDAQAFAYQTIQISGNTAKIFPHFSVLSSNATYYVTIDNGAFTDAAGAYFAGITATNVWQFTTKVDGPVDTNNPVVNADGSADFLTVQGAVNSLAPGTSVTQRVVSLRNGLYNEIVDIAGKHNITLRGQSRTGAVISFPNNLNYQNPVNSGTTHARMTFKVNANDIVLDSLTVSNSTPQGGSQAEALMIESSARRCIVFNSELTSRQDTILANVNSSQAYFCKSLIKGNFDYIWGGGNLYFDQCEIRTIGGTANANFSAARTDTSGATSTNFPWANPGGSYTANGMSFVNCAFTAESGVGTVTLAGSNGTAGNNVSWYGCDFATNYVAPSAGLLSGNYVFWQSANTMTNNSVTFAVLMSLSGNDARLLAATNIPTWFYGWTPQLAPNILTNPMSQTVNYGSPATFAVAATGIPAPTYQWQHAGTNLSGATSASLTVASSTLDDAGAYAVIVTTPAGSVTSTTATLTVNPPSNTAPTFTAPISGTNITINVGVNLAVSCTATDADTPAQTLTYSLLTGPSGAAVDSGTGDFTWRPTVAQSDSTNNVSVVVTDNGTPNLSATNNFTVTVNLLTAPVVTAPAVSGGQFSLTITGQTGPDYTVQVSTNLTDVNWQTILTTNSPALPFTFTDTNGSLPLQFYRILVGP